MTSQKLTLTTLKKQLKQASKDDLIDDIAELFKRFKVVKEYYHVKLNPESEYQVIEKYRQAIEVEFFPSRGFGKARLSIAKKAISDAKKICKDPSYIVDLMVFYVEQGVKFTLAYGDIDEPFYISMETMYENAILMMEDYQISHVFHRRCRKIVEGTVNMGWGFHDTLKEIYDEHFQAST